MTSNQEEFVSDMGGCAVGKSEIININKNQQMIPHAIQKCARNAKTKTNVPLG